MKMMLLIICLGAILLTLGHTRAKPNRIPRSPADTINFRTTIQPILQKNCSPCHFPGGKMYEKMPFDQGATIVSHEAGALKRFKDKEHALIRQFIEEHK